MKTPGCNMTGGFFAEIVEKNEGPREGQGEGQPGSALA